MAQPAAQTGVVGHLACMSAVALAVASLQFPSPALAQTDVLVVADFGNGVDPAPDGFDDLLVRERETGSIAILYLGADGLDLVNQQGPVTHIEVLDGGHGYPPTFEVDESGLSVQVVSAPGLCRVHNPLDVLIATDWAAYLVDGEEGSLLLASHGEEQLLSIDHAEGARTRILIAHEDGGLGYAGLPGSADELHCLDFTRDMPLDAPVTTWSLPGAEAGQAVAIAAPGRTRGVQSFFAWMELPGGPVGSGYEPNVGPPGLELHLVSDIVLPDPVVAETDESAAGDEPANEEGLDLQDAEAEVVTADMLAARVLAQAFADRPEALRLPAARVLTDELGRLTHVSLDPGTCAFDAPPVFTAPPTARCDGLGVLELKLQGQINYVDVPGESAGLGYHDLLEPRLAFTGPGGPGRHPHGIGAVAPEAGVARGTITEARIIGETGIYSRPPGLDLSDAGGLGADLRCRMGHEGTGLVRFNGQDAEMGGNWKAYAADFDGDSDMDLLWHDPRTGRSAVWRLGPDSMVQQGSFGWLPTVERNWRVGAVGEFDPGTPGANIFWRNTRTGANAIWGIDASEYWSSSSSWLHESSGMVDTVADTDWQVVGANRGGNRLLWWNQRTGTCAVWKLSVDMSGDTGPSSWLEHAKWLTNPLGDIMATDTQWKPMGFMNLAGRAPSSLNARDVLWLDTQSGKLAGWLMESNFARVDAEAVDAGANYIESALPEGVSPESARLAAGQYAYGSSNGPSRVGTTLFWLDRAIDGAEAWKLSRTLDSETGLFKDPWQVERAQGVR